MVGELKLITKVINDEIENIKNRLNELEKAGEPLNSYQRASLQGRIYGLYFALGAAKESIVYEEARRGEGCGVRTETATD